jgi:hypothetical protein
MHGAILMSGKILAARGSRISAANASKTCGSPTGSKAVSTET